MHPLTNQLTQHIFKEILEICEHFKINKQTNQKNAFIPNILNLVVLPQYICGRPHKNLS